MNSPADPAAITHKDVQRDAAGNWLVNASATIRALNRSLGWQLPELGPATLNGLLLEKLETIPDARHGAAHRRLRVRGAADRRQLRSARCACASRRRASLQLLKRRRPSACGEAGDPGSSCTPSGAGPARQVLARQDRAPVARLGQLAQRAPRHGPPAAPPRSAPARRKTTSRDRQRAHAQARGQRQGQRQVGRGLADLDAARPD